MQRHILHEFMTGQDSQGAKSYRRFMRIIAALIVTYAAAMSCFLFLIAY
jgi:hypothetical protein